MRGAADALAREGRAGARRVAAALATALVASPVLVSAGSPAPAAASSAAGTAASDRSEDVVQACTSIDNVCVWEISGRNPDRSFTLTVGTQDFRLPPGEPSLPSETSLPLPHYQAGSACLDIRTDHAEEQGCTPEVESDDGDDVPNAPGCPDPRTCGRYEYLWVQQGEALIWPIDADGVTRIPYWINPRQPWVPEEDAIVAVRTAFSTWESAVPTVRFEYRGTTYRPPLPLDGENVVGWSATASPALAETTLVGLDGSLAGASLNLSIDARWDWYPCEQRNNSCTHFRGVFPPTTVNDIQHVVTQHVGHWLNLAPLRYQDARHLTMHPGRNQNLGCCVYRNKVTLGLGDVLGARSLYPCDCDPPTIYRP